MVEVIGKRSRIVPILLTSDMESSLEALLKTREQAGITENNVFVFAIPGTNTHLQFFNVLRKVACSAGLQRPDLVTSTRMRKRLATMAQVCNIGFI
jgi:site-specific recombinase XerC